MNTHRISKLLALAALCAGLGACGGGGGGDDTDTSAGAQTAADPIDKYLGTITLPCSVADEAQDAASGDPVYVKDHWTSVSKVSPAKAEYENTLEYFDTEDCSGTPRATYTRRGANTFFSVDGSTTASGKAVDKITMGRGAIGGLSARDTVTINDLRFIGNWFVEVTADKDIAFIDANQDLYTGDFDAPMDAQGYPTELLATPVGKKQ